MLISLRTLINTTLFWIIIFFGFWLYTKYDSTPAKNMLHIIGRDKLGNIEIVSQTPTTLNSGTVEYLSNQLIAERLSNIEQICNKSIRVSIYDQNTIDTTTPNITNINTAIPTIQPSTTISNNLPGITPTPTNSGTTKTTVIDNSNLLIRTPRL